MPYLSRANSERLRPLVRHVIKEGLMVPSEAADAAGVSRQLVWLWIKDIDWTAARKRYVRRLWMEIVSCRADPARNDA